MRTSRLKTCSWTPSNLPLKQEVMAPLCSLLAPSIIAFGMLDQARVWSDSFISVAARLR
jgi:hypothetical protein